MIHDLKFTGHQHLGPAKHLIRGMCSCGLRTYKTIAATVPTGQNNIRSQHAHHAKNARQACHTATSAGS